MNKVVACTLFCFGWALGLTGVVFVHNERLALVEARAEICMDVLRLEGPL